MRKLLFALLFAGTGAAAGTISLPPAKNECDPEIDWCFSVYCERRECGGVPAREIKTEVRVCLDFRTIIKGDEFIDRCRRRVSKRINAILSEIKNKEREDAAGQ